MFLFLSPYNFSDGLQSQVAAIHNQEEGKPAPSLNIISDQQLKFEIIGWCQMPSPWIVCSMLKRQKLNSYSSQSEMRWRESDTFKRLVEAMGESEAKRRKYLK